MNWSLKILLPVFIIVALAQWLVPAQMIWEREVILKKGKIYRFLTAPVDPNNPFIGKYITLNIKEGAARVDRTFPTKHDQPVYVLLTVDNAGFAKIKSVSLIEPSKEEAYVKAKVNWILNTDHEEPLANIDYPFDEYYMEEHKAPKAELAYQQATRDSTSRTYVQVKIYKGNAVIEDVFINDKPLTSYFK
ncbi:GDYXXLXY domain-containing protein [Longitalea luteola]|uniref:GDYXXLXY domain-containing protein n=1 Tax=Longitalea luteola TaxID=2812563 RepID=UPI001A968480|nr:GDYXXLXY domain-containing protein [Longitalea luteola]